jgi:AcrR family transcriptional regulator
MTLAGFEHDAPPEAPPAGDELAGDPSCDGALLPLALPEAQPLGELPVVGERPRMRADAVRNRRKVLDAARRLFERHGVANVSMDAVAQEAGVGKGTLFRRFGDRATLALSVLEERERELQDALIRGPAPLGPGAPAVERLVAFGAAYVARLDADADLILAAETSREPGARFRGGPYGLYRTHVDLLVREAAPDLDAGYVVDALLAALGTELYLHLRYDRMMPPDRIADGFGELVRRLLTR